MDESSLSEIDYIKQVTFANNTEAGTLNPSPPMNNIVPLYNFTLSSSQLPCICNEETSTPASNGITHILLEPFPLTVIPYSANVL